MEEDPLGGGVVHGNGRCGPWKWDLGYSEGKLYALLTKCEVEMAGYWPLYGF